jgi:hypothetical protein
MLSAFRLVDLLLARFQIVLGLRTYALFVQDDVRFLQLKSGDRLYDEVRLSVHTKVR